MSVVMIHGLGQSTESWNSTIKYMDTIDDMKDFPEEKLIEMEQAFKNFKAEALRMKKDIKAKKIEAKEFTDWIYGQSYIIEQFLD